jgi:hypothetical protein
LKGSTPRARLHEASETPRGLGKDAMKLEIAFLQGLQMMNPFQRIDHPVYFPLSYLQDPEKRRQQRTSKQYLCTLFKKGTFLTKCKMNA